MYGKLSSEDREFLDEIRNFLRVNKKRERRIKNLSNFMEDYDLLADAKESIAKGARYPYYKNIAYGIYDRDDGAIQKKKTLNEKRVLTEKVTKRAEQLRKRMKKLIKEGLI